MRHVLQDRPDPRLQFAGMSRLGHEVGGPKFQSDDTIDRAFARRQNDHRHPRKGSRQKGIDSRVGKGAVFEIDDNQAYRHRRRRQRFPRPPGRQGNVESLGIELE